MSEQTSKAGTSGQKVPKRPKSKFRQKSQQEQTAASKLRMEKRGEKLDAAKEKLAKQKPPKKPSPVKKAGRAVGGGIHGFVHGKLYEVEHENVGTEGAHRCESALRHGSQYVKRQIRQHPAKAVQKAESRHIKATADYHYRRTVEELPEMQKNVVSRYWQKQRLKRQYAKQAREAAKQGAKAAEKTAVTTEKLAARTVAFVKRHPVGVLLFLACFLLLVLMQSCMSSLVTLGNGAAGAIGASTYAAEDADLLGAEAAYCALEDELRDYLDTYTRTHDYDEYHFDLDEIEHDPYVLISMITALKGGEWKIDQVGGILDMLFEKQYILTERVTTETRYRTETRTGTRYVTDPETGESYPEEYEYDVQVPYTYYICHVELCNFNLSHVPVHIMSHDQLSMYAVYMSTLGNRPDLFADSVYVNRYYHTEYEKYEIPPEALADEQFAAIIAEAEKYLGYPYVWGGSSPATSFDCSGFVSYVYNNCGLHWSFGRLGAEGLRRMSAYVSPANAKPGDLIFFEKTYDTSGASHVGIYVGNNMMLHCGDPIQYTSIDTSYWRSHFLQFGRLL